MLFDEVERYFEVREPRRWWQQGDIVLAPTVYLDAGPGATTDGAPEIGEERRSVLWSDPENAASTVTATGSVVPAMIVTHDCALDREFNKRFAELRARGESLDAARRFAAEDQRLDPWVNVAPVIPFSGVPPGSAENLRRNKVIGQFPVCPHPENGIDGGVVDLIKVATIDRDLLTDRLGILTSAARAALRYALAQFWVFRAPKLAFEIEDAVGRRIVDARVAADNPLFVELELQDHTTIRLMQVPAVDADPGPRPGLEPQT